MWPDGRARLERTGRGLSRTGAGVSRGAMTAKDEREARLAARLRENLKRRKAQHPDGAPPPPDPDVTR